MSDSGFSKELFAQFSRIGRVLSTPARVELIYLLSQGEKPVEGLARAAGLSVANASQHLQLLKSTRLVTSRKEGQRVLYRLASPAVDTMWQFLQEIGADRLLEIKELVRIYMEERDELEPVSRDELLKRMSRNDTVVLDVRPEDEYRAGHLPDAHSIPLEQLRSRLGELPQGQTVVAYCRGPYCLLSVDAVEILREAGFEAMRLAEGLPEWRADGHPVESGGLPVS